MPFKIIRNDLTRMRVDAIVNTANEKVAYGDGLDAAVYRLAGEQELLALRSEIGNMKEGEAAITPGLKLPARYIIHAVSPFYREGDDTVEERLRSCYRNSLSIAREYHLQSIAFPLIATGGYGYPKEEGMCIALDEICTFLAENEMMVYLVVFDETAAGLGKQHYPDLESYIDQHYVEEKRREEYGGVFGFPQYARNEAREERSNTGRMRNLFRRNRLQAPSAPAGEEIDFDWGDAAPAPEAQYQADAAPAPVSREPYQEESSPDFSLDYDTFQEEKWSALEERMRHVSDSFQQYLFYLIESRHMSNAEVYKRAIITKQTFSKIKNNPDYHPDKGTAMRLCVGASLNLDETRDLLARAGYALSPCDKRDIIFSYFIEKEVFDMIEIDITLEEHGLPCFIE